ncbi:MAG: winged helix-turn-helix transcriptional regulator [Thermoplasmata archaeon]
MDLDNTDVDILKHLQDNARLSFRELAGKVGVSVPTISARVNTLQELGIIRGYRTDINPQRLDECQIVLLVKCAPSAKSDTAAALAEIEEIRRVMTAQGPRVVALVTVAHRKDVDSLLERVSQVPDVLDYEHLVVASVVKDVSGALITEGLSTILICFQCKDLIHGEPIKVRMDRRDHYFCCHSCEKLYVERYRRIRGAAQA